MDRCLLICSQVPRTFGGLPVRSRRAAKGADLALSKLDEIRLPLALAPVLFEQSSLQLEHTIARSSRHRSRHYNGDPSWE